MNPNKLSIRFVIIKAKTNKRGLCAISCRLTLKSKRKAFSTGLFVNPLEWNAKNQTASSKTNANQQSNLQLEIIAAKLKKVHLRLQLSEVEFTVEEIFQNYLGKPSKKEIGTIQYIKEFLAKKKKLVGIDIQLATWKKFNYACTQAQDFIKWKYRKHDFPTSKLKLQFLNDFEHYLKTEKKQKQVTINKTIQRLRKPIKEAVA